MTALLVPQMTTQEARECVNRIQSHMNGARIELLRLYEAEGWRALGYDSWRACVVAEFEQSQRTLYYQLEAAQIERRVRTDLQILQTEPIPDSHLRALADLPEVDQAMAYRTAVQEAPEGRLTAAHVASVVEQIKQPERMAVHYSSASPEWYTPAHIIAAVEDFFDEIDLDPCAEATDPKTVPARVHFTTADDGLAREWFGRVYMNPPYGDAIPPWIAKLDAAYRSREIEAGIALVPARPDTAWFRILRDYPRCFINGRLKFGGHEDSAPFPSVLVYVGDEVQRFAQSVAHLGDVYIRVEAK